MKTFESLPIERVSVHPEGPKCDGACEVLHVRRADGEVKAEPPAAFKLPWHRETIGHANVGEIADQVARDLAVPLPDGSPPNTDATWIVNSENKIVAFVGNGPRQTENADYIIAAVEAAAQAKP